MKIIYYCPRIKDLREDKDLTQEDVCKILNMKQPQYSRYERGERDLPIEILVILSEFYKVSCDYILGITNDKRGIGYGKPESKYNIKQKHSGKGDNVVNIKGEK